MAVERRTDDRPAWLTVLPPVFEGDAASSGAAFAGLIRYSQERGYAERYPTSEALAQAIREREAHERDCFVCRTSSPEHACPDGQWHAARVERASQQTTGV